MCSSDLAYTIAAARRSGRFERVIVSTDDPRTGAIAEWYGAEYLPRPACLATDDASLVDVTLHALEFAFGTGSRPETFCQLMPNCPLRTSWDIVKHADAFTPDRSFQISVVPYCGVYPQWAMTRDGQGRGQWLFGPQFLVRSQELGQPVCPTGAIWWVRTEAFRAQRQFYGEPLHLAWTNAIRGLDIDHADELQLADLLVRGQWMKHANSPLEPIDRPAFPENPFLAAIQGTSSTAHNGGPSGIQLVSTANAA